MLKSTVLLAILYNFAQYNNIRSNYINFEKSINLSLGLSSLSGYRSSKTKQLVQEFQEEWSISYCSDETLG